MRNVAMAFQTVKRLLVGRPMQSERLGHTLLPKKIALPVFASDALSSVAYATQEILLVLAAGGLAFIAYTPWIALAVGLLMLVVVASYRQNVHAYPSGGGDYEVTTTNFSPQVGMTVASALMVDYTLTVAVSVSSGVANLASAFPSLNSHVTLIAAVTVAVIAILNLRGVRESGTGFAIPTYCFIGVVMLMIVWGGIKLATGHHLHAETAGYAIKSTGTFAGLALVFLILRAFSSGCTALTGVEAISNGVPAFKQPEEQERGHHAGSARRHRGHDVRRRHRAGSGQPRARRDADRHPAGLRAAHGHRAGRPRGLRLLLAAVLHPAAVHGADPGPGGQHRLQRVPGARLDPGQGRVPAAAAAHPR